LIRPAARTIMAAAYQFLTSITRSRILL
jgi:hypothetical protein